MREFMIGEVRAIRDFIVDPDGTLISPVRGTPWTPGENVALCDGRPVEEAHPDTLPPCSCGLAEALPLLAEMKRSLHAAFYADFRHFDTCALVRFSTMSNCVCGFYAFHGSSLYRSGFYSSQACAVVEMWGAGELGPHGVRMSRARVVAVALRQPRRRSVLSPVLYSRWLPVTAAGVAAVTGILVGRWADATNSAGLAVLCGLLLGFAVICGLSVGDHVPPVRYDPDPEKVAARHPDVKIYSDVETMLENHPLSYAPARAGDRQKV